MELTQPKRYSLLALPVLLTLSTALVFSSLSQWLGDHLGYLLGFAFYWIVWCLGVVKWTALAHSLIGLLAFGEPLSTSIVRLVFP